MSSSAARCALSLDGAVLFADDADTVLPTASVGKVFLLCEAAERIEDGRLDPNASVARDAAPAVADSGLWQHLTQESLPLVDACVLVAAVSDNQATNVLLEVLGLAAVAERARLLGCEHSRLHDRVRDHRGPQDPAALSSGTARELAEVARRIHLAAGGSDGLGITPAAARLVERWLLTGVDLTLVAAALQLDPLAHLEGPILMWNKTGWDTGVRAEMGAAWGSDTGIAYAALTRWSGDRAGEDPAFAFLHDTGERVKELITARS